MASISSLGVGSGLDLSSMLDSLTAAQKATLTPISNQQSSFTAKLSAYGTLKSALTTFQTANTALSKADLFSATSTTSSTTRSVPPLRETLSPGNTPSASPIWRRRKP